MKLIILALFIAPSIWRTGLRFGPHGSANISLPELNYCFSTDLWQSSQLLASSAGMGYLHVGKKAKCMYSENSPRTCFFTSVRIFRCPYFLYSSKLLGRQSLVEEGVLIFPFLEKGLSFLQN